MAPSCTPTNPLGGPALLAVDQQVGVGAALRVTQRRRSARPCRVGRREGSDLRDPELGGKDLRREVRSCTDDESGAVTSGTEASQIAAVRMDGIRVPTGRAKDHRRVLARRSSGFATPHAPTVGQPTGCVHPLMTVLGLD